MKNKNNKMKKISILALSLQFITLGQMVNAEEIEKSIEIGGTAVTKKSAKFGEYNGLDQSTVNGGFDIRGGDAYDGQNGTKLWEATGSDLGTTSRSLNGSMSDQGKWKLKIGHDELRHNISDTYQTPQQGSMGGNVFTIPANFGTINSYSGTANSKDSARVLNATQLADFHTEKVSSNRYNTSFGSSYIFNENLNLQVDYNHLEQTGAKLIGSSAQGGVATPTGTDTWKAEAVHILMNPTKYKTDTVDLALNWMTEKGHLTSSYSGSFFRDGYNSLSWQNNLTTNLNGSGACASGGNCTYDNNSMSTAPGNDFHQLNLQGGYNFTPKTKLTAGGSYGRNTQKDGYAATAIAQPNGTIVDTMQLNGLPAANLNGLIIFTNANLLLTNQTTDDLQLSAGIKFNERNNRSPSKTYKYYVLGGVAAGQQYTGINNPYSNRKLQTEVAADYRLSKAQKLRLNFENENIKRWCNDVATNAECVDNPRSRENKVGLNYKIRATEDLSFKAGYNYSTRSADRALTYMTPIGSTTAAPALGIDGKDVVGYTAMPYASRKEKIINAGTTWQATEKLDLALNGSFTQDKYHSTLGVQRTNNEALNLDTTYSYNENHSVSAYVSWQSGLRDMSNGANGTTSLAPTQVWTNRLQDDSSALGLIAENRGLMGGKMEIIGDLSYSLDKSKFATQVPYLATCSASTALTCGSLPDIKSKVVTIKLTDNYQINKNNKVSVGYIYSHRITDDYFYNGYQYGYTPNRVMPTNEQAPTYNISLVTLSYNYLF